MAIDGMKVLVTGASGGLGAHMATMLAGAGARVAVAARRMDALDALAAAHPGMVAVRLDVRDPEAAEPAVRRAADALGGLDGLVNNAGIAWGGKAIEMPAADWQRVIEVNLSGVFHVAQAAAREMARGGGGTGGGAIVNIASILGLGTGAGVAAYATSKAGVVHLTRCLALEWARHGIRVNAIAPGYIPTDINRAYLESAAGQAMEAEIPMRRFGHPEDLDGALALLLGPGGGYITGVTIPVDGGHLSKGL